MLRGLAGAGTVLVLMCHELSPPNTPPPPYPLACPQEWGAFSPDLATFTVLDGKRTVAWCRRQRPTKLGKEALKGLGV